MRSTNARLRTTLAVALTAAAGTQSIGQSPWSSPTPPPAAEVHRPAVVSGPPVRRLTLDEARALALGNKNLVLARLNVEQLHHATVAARKDYLPKVGGNITYYHFNDNLGQVLTFERGRFGILQPGI